jgi:hypothetical protein
MDPEELYEMLMSMSEEELAALGLGGGPSLNQTQYDLASSQYMPPQMNKYGEVEPYDVEVAAKQANLRQDYNQMMVDNVTAAFGGPGSYGVDAFTPMMKYGGDTLQSPGQGQLDYYANSERPGFEALIAQEIAAGSDPSTAVQTLITLAMKPDEDFEGDEEGRAYRDQVRQLLPPNLEAPSGAPRSSSAPELTPEQEFAQQYDVGRVYEFADQLALGMAKDPKGGYTDESTGITYERPPEETWSAAAQWYMDRGLPFPTDSYEDQKYAGAIAPVDVEGWAQNYGDAIGNYDTAHKELLDNKQDLGGMRDMLDAYEAQQRQGGARQSPLGVESPGGNAFSGNVGPAAKSWDSIAQMTYGADRNAPQFGAAGFANPNPPELLQQPTFETPRPGVEKFANLLSALPGGDRLGQDAMKKGSTSQPLDRKLFNQMEGDRQKRAKKDSDAYRARGKAGMASPDMIANIRAVNSGRAMNERGQTPLTDALMQRIIAQRAQGMFGQ